MHCQSISPSHSIKIDWTKITDLIYIYISCRAACTDILDPLSPLLPIGLHSTIVAKSNLYIYIHIYIYICVWGEVFETLI